ncbi:MAG: hypothetical protein JWM16_415 [Verrucomicrobiales bacterium]|nr:hypothetical protein [Verrucomicrobiales bacterium]
MRICLLSDLNFRGYIEMQLSPCPHRNFFNSIKFQSQVKSGQRLKFMNDHRSIWIQEHALGTVQTLRHRGREVQYRLPSEMKDEITPRFKGYGKLVAGQLEDLLLCVKCDRDVDVDATIWVAQSDADAESQEAPVHDKKRYVLTIPKGSRHASR